MASGELSKAIARLRLLLADIKSKERELEGLVRQFQAQLQRTPGQAVYTNLPLDTLLMAMGEMQERLNHAQMTLQHLLAIKQRVERELEALELTLRIQEAKGELASLRKRVRETGVMDEATSLEIQRLEALISEYSQRAARTITGPQGQEGRP